MKEFPPLKLGRKNIMVKRKKHCKGKRHTKKELEEEKDQDPTTIHYSEEDIRLGNVPWTCLGRLVS